MPSLLKQKQKQLLVETEIATSSLGELSLHYPANLSEPTLILLGRTYYLALAIVGSHWVCDPAQAHLDQSPGNILLHQEVFSAQVPREENVNLVRVYQSEKIRHFYC